MGPEVTEHRSSVVTLRSRMMVAFNACAHNVPNSVLAFSLQSAKGAVYAPGHNL